MTNTPDPQVVHADVTRALVEDIGSGDVTAGLIPENTVAQATVVSREAAVLCGRPWFDEVFAELDETVRIDWQVAEGSSIVPDQQLVRLSGNARALLIGERTALNFLQLLSGTATLAHQYARTVAGTNCRILDTRKTIPGLRVAQKYAVRVGGASNHRIGLYDAVLIKENHIASTGGIAEAVAAARAQTDGLTVEVEVENGTELDEALAAGADVIMLDNFSVEELTRAVKHTADRAKLEASGNVTLESLRSIAETGVDYASVGAITKHVRAIDLSMRFRMR
ncbi:MAG: carboxylating nicotinate-nucleotide diphosphorylase [Gammaproteobacteria bacterium]